MNIRDIQAGKLHDAIGADLQGFGGELRCVEGCGRAQPLGDIGGKLRYGWPKCCGYTMCWITARELAALTQGPDTE